MNLRIDVEDVNSRGVTQIWHAQWALDAFFGPGIEPGVFGQVYRAAGAVAFPMFSVAEALPKIIR